MAELERDQVVGEVRQRVDLVTLIGEVVKLQRAGRKWKGLCPFHQEKTPSFHVDPDKQLFHCFGCKAGGDVFQFLMLHQGLSFPEALEVLADRVGVPLPNAVGGSQAERQRHRKALDELFGLTDLATSYFHQTLLHHTEAQQARDYLAQRGLGPGVISAFQLGYARQAWDALLRALGGRGYAPESLEKAGLVLKRQDGSGFYDRFRGRVIFPIRGRNGRVLGYGGRVMGDDQPKYLNSAENEIFAKNQVLYGLYEARDAIRQTGQVIVVEGYMDVLRGVEAGFSNIIASLGTALTDGQVKEIARVAQRVIIAYDADTAGESGTLRGLTILQEAGLEVRVARLPQGHDPDSLIGSLGAEAFGQILETAPDLFRFHLDRALESIRPDDISSKVRAVGELLPVVRRFPGRVAQKACLEQISQELGLDLEALEEEFFRQGRKSRNRRDSLPQNGEYRRGKEARSLPLAQQTLREAEEDLLVGAVLDTAFREILLREGGVDLFSQKDTAERILTGDTNEDTLESWRVRPRPSKERLLAAFARIQKERLAQRLAGIEGQLQEWQGDLRSLIDISKALKAWREALRQRSVPRW